MPPDITALLSLQERDLRLQELRKELTRIPMEQELAGKRLAAHQAEIKPLQRLFENLACN